MNRNDTIKLVPSEPPGRSSRKARRFAPEMRALRAQGYTFEAIRLALASSGVHVSNATVQREVARATKATSVARARAPMLVQKNGRPPSPNRWRPHPHLQPPRPSHLRSFPCKRTCAAARRSPKRSPAAESPTPWRSPGSTQRTRHENRRHQLLGERGQNHHRQAPAAAAYRQVRSCFPSKA